MNKNGKIYFASDFHLGLPAGSPPLEREKRVVSWLKEVAADAREIYLLGDIFDFWWEYKHVVPKGFTRFLGSVAEITDSGIPVHFFTGNHDMWTKDYLETECGMTVHFAPVTTVFDGTVFHLAHGEGLGSTGTGYKILLYIFRNKTIQRLYSSLHPAFGIRIGQKWSLSSRLGKGVKLEFLGEDNEDLIRYAREILKKEKIQYFIFGHRHLGMTFKIAGTSEVVFLSDWISKGSFAVWDGTTLKFIMLP